MPNKPTKPGANVDKYSEYYRARSLALRPPYPASPSVQSNRQPSNTQTKTAFID
jgi:hypothetical protein